MEVYTSSFPRQYYTLREFVREAETLCNGEGPQPDFVRFLLTGEHLRKGHQAVIDATANALPPSHPLEFYRNYDSLVGLTDNIVVDSDLSIYLESDPAKAIRSGLHIYYPVEDENGVERSQVLVHHIPNFEFGYWGHLQKIHIFFPALARESARLGSLLSWEERRVFYEQGLRPAIAELIPHSLCHWPTSYPGGPFSPDQAQTVPQLYLRVLPDSIRDHLEANGVSWASGFFFTHTVHGMRRTTDHFSNPRAAQDALDKFLHKIKIPYSATVNEGSWWLDVGIDYTSIQKKCLQWATSSHSCVVQEVLSLSATQSHSITHPSYPRYTHDVSGHLAGASGCKIELPSGEGPFEVVYFQMSMTPRSIPYDLNGEVYRRGITVQEAMNKDEVADCINGLVEFCMQSRDAKEGSTDVRVAVCVPLVHAANVMVTGSINVVLQQSLLNFSKSTWWNWHGLRTLAIGEVLCRQVSGNPVFRCRPTALLLTAACVWLVNGIYSRPDDSPSARDLMRAVLPLTDAQDANALTVLFTSNEQNEDSGLESVPYIPDGAIFLRRIICDVEVPRMRLGGPLLSPDALRVYLHAFA